MRAEGKLHLFYVKHQLSRYNKTLEEYHRQIEEQNDACAICKEPFTKTPHNDHNHRTNMNRGLLCFTCNATIGYSQESPEILRAAAVYLEKWAEKDNL